MTLRVERKYLKTDESIHERSVMRREGQGMNAVQRTSLSYITSTYTDIVRRDPSFSNRIKVLVC